MNYFFTSPKFTSDEYVAIVVTYATTMVIIVISIAILTCFIAAYKKQKSTNSFSCLSAQNTDTYSMMSGQEQSQNFLLHETAITYDNTDLNFFSTDAGTRDLPAFPLVSVPDSHRGWPLIRREFIDGSRNEARFPWTSTSSNDACAIEASQFLQEVETGEHSLTNQTSDQACNATNEKLFLKIKDAFGEVHELSLDSSGLVYHCSQYGVTLIIPEGAVQESATVWFGACLFSDKFKFGDYVPVTPIVWVHIDQKLDKSAELYIPHDVAISSDTNLQQFTVLTAHDDDCSDVISFQENCGSQAESTSGLQIFKILSPHFCSNCIAAQKGEYKFIPRRYLIARADKKNGRELSVQFIFLCQQEGCTEVVEDQCAKEGFNILSYEPVTFTGDGQVSLSFEPHSVPGWKRKEVGFSKDHISSEDIDYYQMMGCENAAEVTEDELKRLKLLEKKLSYPPRFRIQFISDAVVEKSQKVIVHFNQVHPPVKSTILLEGSIQLLLSPASSTSSTGSTMDVMTYANDSLLGDCLRIIASEGNLKEKWFDFGYILGFAIGQLHNIELTSIDPIQHTRKVLIQWRDQNRSESWEPLAAALAKIGFKDLAHRVKDHFESPPVPEPEPEDIEDHYKGVYCNLCKDYHLKPEDIQQEIQAPKVNSPPDIVDLTNLVAAKIQDKFYQFGTALHLDDSFLRSLYDTYHDPMDRFIAVFNRWKDNDPDTYTWSTVIKVLQSDAIGAHAVAQDVMKHLTTNADSLATQDYNAEAAEHASN
uniref:Death domain-containing protein n=1 Tax=Amphimedon queenslandica TaxID=400682 RepID=A0A1X7UGG2_AMPQE